ncbi:MAG TPA: hypothetical protein VLE96_01840 [Chlamydiales bacterium]|nr:hypothetical protein [Chlamydiales bacterium]
MSNPIQANSGRFPGQDIAEFLVCPFTLLPGAIYHIFEATFELLQLKSPEKYGDGTEVNSEQKLKSGLSGTLVLGSMATLEIIAIKFIWDVFSSSRK